MKEREYMEWRNEGWHYEEDKCALERLKAHEAIYKILLSRFERQHRVFLHEYYTVTKHLSKKQEEDLKKYMNETANMIIEELWGK